MPTLEPFLMRKSWKNFFRRVAGVCFMCGASAWSSALCYAQGAADSAMDPIYADGWQAGDNGGTGFGPWNFTGTYDSAVQQAINSTSPHNQLGTAWTLYNPEGREPDPGMGGATDIAQAGRAITGGLQPGQTFSVVVDNPIERRFFRGYTVRLNTGGGNTVYQGDPVSRLAVGTFEYFTNGKWYATGTGGNPPFFDTDTDEGMRIDVTLTGANTYDLVMTPLDNPESAFMASGMLEGTGPIDWVEFEFFNTDSDFYPIAEPMPKATDFYIGMMSVTTGEMGWNVDANGNWSISANWTGGVPNGNGAQAVFGSIITAPRTVTIDGARTVGTLTFDNAQSYTLAGPGPLTINGDGDGAAFEVLQGSHTISAPLTIAAGNTVTKSGAGTLTISGTQSHGAGAVLVASAGVTNLNSDGGQNLSVRANAQLNIGATQHLGGLQIGAGGTTRITTGGVKNVVTGALTIAGGATPTGTLDVTSQGVVVDYPAAGPNPGPDIRAQIIAGRGAPGLIGTWDGKGITSSTSAAAPDSTSVGYAVNGDMPLGPVATFRGDTVDVSSVLIRHTRTGDATLDGVVNDDDVTIVGATYAPGVAQASWALGDFDYNGFVDDDDITLLGVFYDPSAPPVLAPIAVSGAGVAAVPEPSAIWLFIAGCAGALALTHRRNRNSQRRSAETLTKVVSARIVV
jgi:autotransporter-associated beta strand protein